MNGPDHYREAEGLVSEARQYNTNEALYAGLIAEAQVHATLALAAATAYGAVRDYYGDEGHDSREWASATAVSS